MNNSLKNVETGLQPRQYPRDVSSSCMYLIGKAVSFFLVSGSNLMCEAVVGAVPKVRRTMGGLREHPYSRVAGLTNYGSMPGIATMAGMQGLTGVPGMTTSLPYLKMEG